VENSQLQKPNSPEVDDYIIERYKKLYAAFFETRKLIPSQNFTEIAFENLESEPLTVLEQIYHDLSLNNFEQVKPIFQKYIEAHANYKKNTYSDISGELRTKITKQWEQSFNEWNYKS
jgi:hypothetical protein